MTYGIPWGPNGPQKGTTVSLLQRPGLERWEEFTCLNSLRDVEPTVKLVIEDGGLDDLSPGAAEPDAIGSNAGKGEGDEQ